MKKELKTTVLEMVLPPASENEVKEHSNFSGITIGTLTGFRESGEPLVVFPGARSKEPVKALSTVALVHDLIGRAVALQFEGSDPHKPVILGVIQNSIDAVKHSENTQHEKDAKRVEVELDGERLVFTADKEIILRCGKSSITLTRAGKILIRGAYLLNRSSGVNRIKGGSVQIN